MTKTIEINFGISDYARYAPGPWEERKMPILLTGELQKLSPIRYFELEKAGVKKGVVCDYYDARKRKFNELPAVLFRLPVDGLDELTMKLIWTEERREWVAVKHTAWVEAACRTDESEWGPFQLDNYCKKMLAVAYGTDIKKSDKNISTMSPRELEQITN